jgi:hypothetical protein
MSHNFVAAEAPGLDPGLLILAHDPLLIQTHADSAQYSLDCGISRSRQALMVGCPRTCPMRGLGREFTAGPTLSLCFGTDPTAGLMAVVSPCT